MYFKLANISIKPALKNHVKSLKEGIILSSIIIITSLIIFTQSIKKAENLDEVDEFLNNIYLKKTVENIFINIKPKFKQINHVVLKGENFENIFNSYSVPKKEIKKILELLNDDASLKKLNAGTEIEFLVDQSSNEILELKIPISSTKNIILSKKDEGEKFDKKSISTKLIKRIIYEENVILNSLYRSASTKNIPANIIVEFARIYGFEVDFQRDIRKQDSFQIMYEIFYDDNNNISKTGKILFANLNLSGQNNELYYFKNEKIEGHFNKSGKSIIKTLMKTPINGARLSSSFGMRKHPIDGFNKMHRGTDFAAPTGTPILASGDGIITKVGWCGGGGNCIKIKHNSTYQTVYAHMSKFARNIKRGTRVKQGMIIGFVGSTGKSTGPHLHYEVIVNGKRVNSQTLKLPSGRALKKNNRAQFETQKIKIDVLKSEKIMGLI